MTYLDEEEAVRLTVNESARIWIRLEIHPAPPLASWLVFALPNPQDRSEPSGFILPDPKHPEIVVKLNWDELPGAFPLSVLHVEVADHSWELHQDSRNPSHWLRETDHDHGREWS